MLNFLKKYRVNILFSIVGIVFVAKFHDSNAFSWADLLPGFGLYCLLSLITGLRFYSLLKLTENINLSLGEIISIPARMNLFSYVLPFKGGGIWLIWYLKTRYGLGFIKSLGMAFQNASLAISLLLLLVINHDASMNFQSMLWTALLLILLINAVIFITRRSIGHHVRLGVVIYDLILSLLYLSVTCILPMSLFEVSTQQSLVFAALIISSSLIKITPGNIGVLEGMAAIASIWYQDSGFLQFVAFFRLLSLLHATTFGIGSVLLNKPALLKDQ